MSPQHPSGLPSFYKYNFLPDDDELLGARLPHVRFYQHQGTLNAREMIYWIIFICGLFQLAGTISDSSLERLVHLNDKGDVSITELFMMMAVGNHDADPQLMEMIKYYTRKIMTRGGQTRKKTRLSLRARETGASELVWKDLRPEDRLRKYGNHACSSKIASRKRPAGQGRGFKSALFHFLTVFSQT